VVTNDDMTLWTDLLVARALAHGETAEHGEAYRYFELAVHELDDPERLSPRALALYGRAMAETQPTRMPQAVRLCRYACRQDDDDAEPYMQLAHVLLLAEARNKAIAALDRGLKVRPDDPGLSSLRSELGRRRPPVLGFLPRAHAVNRWLGRLRHQLQSPVATDARAA